MHICAYIYMTTFITHAHTHMSLCLKLIPVHPSPWRGWRAQVSAPTLRSSASSRKDDMAMASAGFVKVGTR